MNHRSSWISTTEGVEQCKVGPTNVSARESIKAHSPWLGHIHSMINFCINIYVVEELRLS